jgi:hypothetical protein
MSTSLQLLQAARINTIMQAIQDTRLLPQQLKFLSRTAVVPATDGEIMASYQGYAQIADLVADDATALTYNTGKFVFETTNVPNLKLGVHMTQETINQMLAIQASQASAMDRIAFLDWESRTIDALLLGVRQRMEALIVAMMVGSLSYDRLGIRMTNVSWGRPSDLNVTPSITWDNPTTATPVSDILTVKRVAAVRYGEVFNRVTMSTQALIYMVATAEFQAKAKAWIPVGFTFANENIDNLDQMNGLASKVLGMQIETYDARYWSQSPAGALTSQPFLPTSAVVLSATDDDNDPGCLDFANGVVTESVVASLANTSMAGSLGGAQRGPLAYATVPPDLNPPNVTYWGVARGFPRLHRKSCGACLTVGTFTDTAIPVGEPSLL